MTKTILFWLGILGALFFIVAAVLGGLQMENYNHLQQFISESYATGTPYGNHLRFLGYLPSGIMLTLFAFFAPMYLPHSRLVKVAFWLVAIFYGLGTIMVSFFPCDQGCNREFIDPSLSQIIHNLVGGLTYLIVPFAIVFIGIKARAWADYKSYSSITLVCGIIALLFAWLMMADPNVSYIGLFQRLVEGSILFWVVKTAILIRKTRA